MRCSGYFPNLWMCCSGYFPNIRLFWIKRYIFTTRPRGKTWECEFLRAGVGARNSVAANILYFPSAMSDLQLANRARTTGVVKPHVINGVNYLLWAGPHLLQRIFQSEGVARGMRMFLNGGWRIPTGADWGAIEDATANGDISLCLRGEGCFRDERREGIAGPTHVINMMRVWKVLLGPQNI